MHLIFKYSISAKNTLHWLVIILLFTSKSFAQLDTVNYHVGLLTGISSQNSLPHWITANRFGMLHDQDYAVGLATVGAETKFKASEHWSFGIGINAIAKLPYVQEQEKDVFLQEGYAKIKFNIFELVGGRIQRTLGTHAQDISTGSLALSGNALPVPQILLRVSDYHPLPFTKEFVKFKGTYSHGWLGKERFVQNAYLHEKSFYLKFGGKYKVNFSAGLVHYVIWGGENARVGKLPADLRDYINVILGKSAEGVDLNDPFLLGEAANALGDNLGIYDFGLYIRHKKADILLYHQTPFEDWTGTRLFRNKDRLLGINWSNKKTQKWIESAVYEFLYTKYQSGPGRPGGPKGGGKEKYGYDFGGRDNYYNNYLYKTGWVYQNRILGTPLFFTKNRMKLFYPDFVDPDESGFNFNVVNNRIVAHHIGIKGSLSKSLQYKFLSTFTKNYGTYGGINGGINRWDSIENPDFEYAFKPPKHQNYFLLEVESNPFSKLWVLQTAIAWDTGKLSHNFGALIGLKRKIQIIKSSSK